LSKQYHIRWRKCQKYFYVTLYIVLHKINVDVIGLLNTNCNIDPSQINLLYPPVTVNPSVKTFPYYSYSNWYLCQRKMFTWALKPNKMQKHCLIGWRNVGSLTFFVCISYVMAPKSHYLKSVNHKIVMWNTNRPRRLYFTIFFNLLFPHFPIFSLNCICCYLFSAENFSVFMYNFIHFHVQNLY
jgi:hypothetical protein